ncbi:ras GTPase-activating protein-binding protein 2 isoform X2 [Drosophila navojoa]|uniref:ras GTPase-activating protein-binding protein 2 isoform X2 n=1 Tax=Drosophila navojoa TaxID=7232 RepID=UPI0008463838|nr:ras GTPase-activating protein-binding protein 2 isoform X2 [Drosophila navojoa]
MVMDATQSQQPSPQSVGREFVRQYYTLLNKAPNHLHRFYNNNSSFIHGESTLVVGQREIHNRIQQLNFNDCHAKISQVDAQATLGNGVVVQVTGELSNDGQPMRRFTQTFVLAAQSPKKYYVHNDIFRYQDLYIEDEPDGESRSENDEDHDVQVQGVDQAVQVVGEAAQQPQQLSTQVVLPQPVVPVAAAGGAAGAPQQLFYPLPAGAATGRPVAVLPAAPQAAAVPLPAQFTNPPPPIQNGVVPHDELPQQQGPPQALVQANVSPLVQQQPSGPVMLSNVGIVQPVPVQPAAAFQHSPLVSAPPQLIPQQHQQQQQQQQQQQTQSTVYTTSSSGGGSGGQASYSTTASSSYNNTNNNSRLDNGGPLPQRNNLIRNKEFEQRRPSNAQQFGDNQQLFLGNIPHHASEEELRQLFSRFGNVIDLRILSKVGKIITGTRSPLNYGFITYDDAEAVQKCLANCPLYFPENSPDGQKLNVEEKKPRMRNDMPPRQPIGGNNVNNMGRNNMRAGGGNNGPRMGGNNGASFGQRNDNRSGGGNQSNGPLRGAGNGQTGGGNYGRR